MSKRTVESGYDAIADAYLAWGAGVGSDPRDRFLDQLIQRLFAGARVLDLGCGAGIPATKKLADRFQVTGVDISRQQLLRAQANVPNARLVQGDFSELDFPDASFDGIAAFYSISHIPRTEHRDLFAKVARWLTPGGLFLATLGASDLPDRTREWLGVPMFFSSHDAATNRRLLLDAGLILVVDEVVSTNEPDGEVSFLWVLAQKPSISR